MTDRLIIQPSGEESAERVIRPEERGLALSAFLARHGYPLRTLCGERGLCQGCKVALRGEGGAEMVRACQTTAGAAAGAGRTVFIPESSKFTAAFHAVTAFTIEIPERAAGRAEGLGLAVDIGTTTVAVALWDLAAGRCLQTASRANAQFRFGDNVLSRITFALERPGNSERLQTVLLRESLLPLIAEVCESAGAAPGRIVRCRIAANTIMLHTLGGFPLEGFSRYPFRPVFLGAREFPPELLGLPSGCDVRSLPCPGAFVGADITAGALACGLDAVPAPALLVDFGTNGEILLKHREGFLATATAAGPAFEGGRLASGSVVRDGVVTGMTYVPAENTWRLSVAGDVRPENATGLSGPAYIDFLAQAVENGIISRFGRFLGDHGAVSAGGGEGASGKRLYLTKSLYISEADIAELLQAKAAIAGGVSALLEHAGVAPEELRAVFIAGGFGYHIRPGHALRVGLFPSVPEERLHIVGNAALGGASLALFAEDDEAAAAVTKCEVAELNTLETFEDHFTDALAL